MTETEMNIIYNKTHHGRNKELSCGFIIVDKKTGKYLGCHPTGKKRVFDITKGHLDPPEDELSCAIRECKEETGIVVSRNDPIFDCGVMPYKSDKDLHIFIIVKDVNIPQLHCDSKFNLYGRMVPEMSGYSLLDNFDEFYGGLQDVLRKCISKIGAKEFIESQRI